MNKLYIEIGSRIATLRREQKLTQAQLAEKLDISIKHCSEIERGLSCLSLEKMITLCSILSTNLDYLVRGINLETNAEFTPTYVNEMFNSYDKKHSDLLKEYILLFKKITDIK